MAFYVISRQRPAADEFCQFFICIDEQLTLSYLPPDILECIFARNLVCVCLVQDAVHLADGHAFRVFMQHVIYRGEKRSETIFFIQK